MALEINYIGRSNNAFTKLKNLYDNQPFEKRDVIALDFEKLVDQLIVKHGKSKPKKISISRLRLGVNRIHWNKLTIFEKSDREVLEKMIEWQDEYEHVAWEDFRDHYFKCDDCGSYDNEPCICYAR